MKLLDLKEMTVKAESYETLEKWIPEYSNLKDVGEHTGDIEDYSVYKRNRNDLIDYSIFLDDKIVAFFVVKKPDILSIAFVKKEYRKIGIFSLFLFFLKRNENFSKIVLDNSHSRDTINALKRIHTRFKTYWTDGSKEIKFDPNKEEPFYSSKKPTKWKIVLENDGDFSDWPKYYPKPGEMPDLHTFYFCFLDEEE